MSGLGVATSGVASTGTSFKDTASAFFAVAASNWATCPSGVSTVKGPVTFVPAVPGADGLIGLCAPDGGWWAYYQGDGNFVIYDMRTGMAPTRASVTGGSRSMVLQADGNLVITAGDGSSSRSTGTAGIPGPVTLALGDDGNLTITDANGTVRWSSAPLASVICPPSGSVFMCGGPW